MVVLVYSKHRYVVWENLKNINYFCVKQNTLNINLLAMKKGKLNSFLISILGLVILLLSIFLDEIGIGSTPGYGLVQIAGMIVGATMVVYGGYKAFKN